MKIKLTNAAPVAIGGRHPGEVFSVVADDKGRPVNSYDRKRLNEGAYRKVDEPAPAEAEPAKPEPVKAKKEKADV